MTLQKAFVTASFLRSVWCVLALRGLKLIWKIDYTEFLKKAWLSHKESHQGGLYVQRHHAETSVRSHGRTFSAGLVK